MKLRLTPIGAAILAALPLIYLAACGGTATPPASSQQQPPPAAPSPPPPISANHTVRGEVFSFDTGMIAGADINLWVQTEGFGYSYWWARGPLWSDALGLFEADLLPDSQITITAHADDYVQPCAVRTDLRDDFAVRVEMIETWRLQTDTPRRPQLGGEPSVTGIIYETTASGRQPIAEASLWVEGDVMDFGLAMTQSERGGGFYLCNLGPSVWIHVSKAGFVDSWIGPIDATESRILEIELNRFQGWD